MLTSLYLLTASKKMSLFRSSSSSFLFWWNKLLIVFMAIPPCGLSFFPDVQHQYILCIRLHVKRENVPVLVKL